MDPVELDKLRFRARFMTRAAMSQDLLEMSALATELNPNRELVAGGLCHNKEEASVTLKSHVYLNWSFIDECLLAYPKMTSNLSVQKLSGGKTGSETVHLRLQRIDLPIAAYRSGKADKLLLDVEWVCCKVLMQQPRFLPNCKLY